MRHRYEMSIRINIKSWIDGIYKLNKFSYEKLHCEYLVLTLHIHGALFWQRQSTIVSSLTFVDRRKALPTQKGRLAWQICCLSHARRRAFLGKGPLRTILVKIF